MRESWEIEKMLNTLKNELNSLPDYSTFGSSNIEEKEEMAVWIEELKEYVETSGNVLPKNQDSEVYQWLFNKFSVLDDYEL